MNIFARVLAFIYLSMALLARFDSDLDIFVF